MSGLAPSQTVLNALHCDAIAHWKAQGCSVRETVEKLSEGCHFASEQPTPVEVSESAVRYRLGTDDVSRRVLHWRMVIYGEMTSPLAFAAERMRRLERIWASAEKDLDAAERPQDRAGARRDLLAVVAAAQKIAERSEAEMTIGLRAAGGQRAEATIAAESLDALAAKLEGLKAAGLLPGLTPEPVAQSELVPSGGENGVGDSGPLIDVETA